MIPYKSSLLNRNLPRANNNPAHHGSPSSTMLTECLEPSLAPYTRPPRLINNVWSASISTPWICWRWCWCNTFRWYHGQSTHVYNIKSILKSEFLANSERMCSPFFTRNKLDKLFSAIDNRGPRGNWFGTIDFTSYPIWIFYIWGFPK